MLITFILFLTLTSIQTKTVSSYNSTQDSEELRLQDMLTPYIEKDLNSYYYPNILKDFSANVTPWKIEVIETKRVNSFRGFLLQITFEIELTDGGHYIPVGKDRMTYEISPRPRLN